MPVKRNALTDNLLVKKILTDSRESCDELVAVYGQSVLAIVARIVPDMRDAEEITQDTMLAVIRNIRRYDPRQCTLSAWIGRIACNNAVSFVRRKQVHTVSLENTDAEQAAMAWQTEAEDSHAEQDRIELLKQAVRTLPPSDQMLLSLHHLDSRPLSELAVIYDTTPDILARRLYRIRKKLYTMLKDRLFS